MKLNKSLFTEIDNLLSHTFSMSTILSNKYYVGCVIRPKEKYFIFKLHAQYIKIGFTYKEKKVYTSNVIEIMKEGEG